MSDNKPQEVYKAIAAVTRALGREGISKGRKNAQQGYSFRGIDDIYNALNSELAEANLCIIPRVMAREVVERQTKNGGALFYVTIHAEYDIVSAVDGSCHTASAYGEAMDSGDKATNKAMSAAYKYMAMQLFCIPTEGDNDADASTHEVAARGATFAPPQQRQQPRQQAPAPPIPASAPMACDVCGTQVKDGKWGPYCPAKENHGGKFYTVKNPVVLMPSVDVSDEWDDIDNAPSVRRRAPVDESLL